MSEMQTMSDGNIKAISDFVSLDSELKGLYVQLNNHERSLKDIANLRRKYKKDPKREMFLVMSQNLMRNMDNDEILTMLDERRKQTSIALDAIKGQISHREDAYREAMGKMLVYIKRVIDPEVFADIISE